MKREIPLFIIDTKKSHKHGECDFLTCTDVDNGFVARIDYVENEAPGMGDNYIVGYKRGVLAVKMTIKRIIGLNPNQGNIRTLMKKGLDYYVESVTLAVGATEVTTKQCIDVMDQLAEGNKHYIKEFGSDFEQLQTIKTSLMMLDAIKHKLSTVLASDYKGDIGNNSVQPDIIAELRIACGGKTMQELAELSGVSTATIFRTMNGSCNPSLSVVIKLANAVGKKIVLK